MKMAFITDDGKTISRHFGRARYYLVLEIEDGEVRNREMRDKLGHFHFVNEEDHNETDHGHGGNSGHGMDAGSHRKHTQMADAISDCEVIVCGGMGLGAYRSMQSFDIKPIVTDKISIDEALQEFLAGNLKDQTNLVH